MKRQLFYLSLSLLAVMFAACSSDTDGDGTGRAMYEYTPEQIQQIKNLQEEYGVTFNFPVNSSKGLPPVSDFEDLCKTFAYLNSAKEEVTRSGNTIKCRTVQRTRTRAFSRGVEETYYSGSEIGHGDLNGNNESYGSFSYLVSWEGVNSGHSKNVSYQIYSLQYNPQNEMFSHFGTKRYNFKNETQLFKVIPHTSKNQKKSTGFAGTKYI